MNRCVWANEIDKFACGIYRRHWSDGTLHQGDIRDVLGELEQEDFGTIDVVCGGDPCPARSLARGDRPSKHPDLSGYFLAVVGRLRPPWVVRENVCAPDIVNFAAGLELLGYGIAVVALDARDFTGQSRRRQFCIGCPHELYARFERFVSNAADGYGFAASRVEEETPIAACLTAHPNRVAAEDTYCYEPGRGLRMLDPSECESLQGFPRGWTSGLSRSRRRILLGNAVNTLVARWLAERIMETTGREFTFIELFAGIGGFRLGFESAGTTLTPD
ncbi:DNA cytosine methyltransferase [bacterium]|nr:DNA cytosine methyltransferase [bacterium]